MTSWDHETKIIFYYGTTQSSLWHIQLLLLPSQSFGLSTSKLTNYVTRFARTHAVIIDSFPQFLVGVATGTPSLADYLSYLISTTH